MGQKAKDGWFWKAWLVDAWRLVGLYGLLLHRFVVDYNCCRLLNIQLRPVVKPLPSNWRGWLHKLNTWMVSWFGWLGANQLRMPPFSQTFHEKSWRASGATNWNQGLAGSFNHFLRSLATLFNFQSAFGRWGGKKMYCWNFHILLPSVLFGHVSPCHPSISRRSLWFIATPQVDLLAKLLRGFIHLPHSLLIFILPRCSVFVFPFYTALTGCFPKSTLQEPEARTPQANLLGCCLKIMDLQWHESKVAR